ncbi:MAG TPA: carbon storage regulator [Petrotogaceae bacterium]|jgi:carbon storage regulator|nr:carbon storage regulator [Petrotogaceae bacterium]HQO11790.1 carbon storage regulator [Petrotogaceae bacterium]HQP57792.1 carbon storage regulator [Petrotogaceae bacterium]
MLVLTRKTNEYVEIIAGDRHIKITILDSNRGTVKIGFDAEKDIKIYRGEVYDEIVSQNISSVNTDIKSLKDISRILPGGKKGED